MKINYDASFSESDMKSNSGIVIRNDKGEIMVAATYLKYPIANLEHAEALACEQALILAQELGFRRVEVEGDSLGVVTKLKNWEAYKGFLSTLYRNIQRRGNSFDYLCFSYACREKNGVAHALTRITLPSDEPMVWIEEAPQLVLHLVRRDLSGCNQPP
ncbi:hypothetical protein like AT2G04420 [Hibiscus trionum]|uniref:RNase H type-1 domain-containing protein n=1 Tax=Hibiscus trionum TaxID=183268 RepID=A0A9W7MQD3_HIBTR|nr:hypothetical protein like AT2G04420 [Hibiscus trionum]